MEEVINFINNEIKLETEEKIIVAVSGGPDSMCLLNILMKLFSHEKIVCTHVNHNVRKESDDEAIFLENFCKENSIIFEYMKIREYSKENFHNDARNKRYTFFKEVLKKYNSKYLLTAHHADDLMETIIMRIIRGSSLNGYKGFSRRVTNNDIIILRPIITMTKNDILNYCTNNDVKYVTDNSNFSDKYTRNRIRNKIVPELKEENKDVHKNFLKFSKDLEETYNYINILASKRIKKIYKNNILNIDIFNKEDIVIKKEIINQILQKKYKEEISLITDKNVFDIFKLINTNKSNLFINLPKNFIAKKEYNNLTIEKETDNLIYKHKLDKKVILPNDKIIEIIDYIPGNSNDICLLKSGDISFPLYIRTKKDGDCIELLNTKGKQKVKDIFINKKIGLSDRKTWPLLVDSKDKILWVPGLKKTKDDKSKTKNYDIIIWYH